MTSRDFVYWLQGYFEIADKAQASAVTPGLTPPQVDVIRRHLAMVFVHEIDPSFPKNQQQQLNDVHATRTTPTNPTAGPAFEPAFDPGFVMKC